MPTIIWERAFEIESQGSKKLKGHLSYESTFMHISYQATNSVGIYVVVVLGFSVNLGLEFPIQFVGQKIVLEKLNLLAIKL